MRLPITPIACLFWVVSTLGVHKVCAQSFESAPSSLRGMPAITNYGPGLYKGSPQVWSIIEDDRGVMYFGANAIIEYDGVNWTYVKNSQESLKAGRCMAKDSSGRIYVGGIGEMGYLDIDAFGQTQYISLKDKVPQAHRDFADVWSVVVMGADVYFSTYQEIFRLTPDEDSMRVWTFEGGNIQIQQAGDDKLYICQEHVGFQVLQDEGANLLPEGAFFADKFINMIKRFGDEELLIGTLDQGLYLYDGRTVKPFKTEIDDFIRRYPLYFPGVVLQNGHYAIHTIGGGIFIIDQEGRLIERIYSATGLAKDVVFYLYEDSKGNLWAGLSGGISRIELNAPLRYIDKRMGLDSWVLAIAEHEGMFYVGTERYLQYYDATEQLFKPVSGISPTNCYTLFPVDGELLAGGGAGIHYIVGQYAVPVRANSPAQKFTHDMVRSRRDTNLIFTGDTDGVGVLRRRSDGVWRYEGMVPEFQELSYKIEVDMQGAIWAAGQFTDKFHRVFCRDWTDMKHPQITSYGPEQGVSSMGSAFYIDGRLYSKSDSGIVRLDTTSMHFVPDTSFGAQVKWMGDIDGKAVWLGWEEAYALATPQEQGGYALQKAPLALEEGEFISYAKNSTEQADIAWMGTPTRLIRWDKSIEYNASMDVSPLIRSVVMAGDSLLRITGEPPTIDHAGNRMEIAYAAPYFHQESRTQYQTWMEGLDKEWSDWSSETDQEFMHLSPGKYVFHMRARNVFKKESKETTFAFAILPPWWQTWWAICVAILLLTGLTLAIRRYELRRLIARSEAKRISELNSMKVKLYTNITHEFRTPLTVIMGIADTIRNKEYTEERSLIKRNSKKLLLLINQLLDLSKFDQGLMRPALVQSDVVKYLNYLVESFYSMAGEKEVRLLFYPENPEVIMDFDEDKLQHVVYNLISNALKFTGKGDRVVLHARKLDSETKPQLQLKVQDTGIGIPEEELPHIFQRFYQVDGTHTRSGEGTGIGLALAREYLENMGGKISVKSKLGEGTEFTILLPITNNAPLESPRELQEVYVHEGRALSETTITGNASGEGLAGERPILLIVEDNEDVIVYIKSVVQSQYQVETARNGQEGLEKATAQVPDIIVSDVMMPEMDGFSLTKTLKNDGRTSHIPIILLTARAAQESRITGLESGADAYLSKPFDKSELLIRLEKLTALRLALQKRYAGSGSDPAAPDAPQNLEEQFLYKARQVVEAHLADAEFSVEQFCREMRMSQSQLYRKLVALTGKSPALFVRAYRLNKAAPMLRDTALNISEVAWETGFNDPGYFSRAFREEFGKSPSEWRN